MYDVALYGNLVLDYIYEQFDKKYSLGGIANVWHAFTKINPKLTVQLIPSDLGEAIIYIDSAKSMRYSKANLSIINQRPNIVNAKISHVAYLNTINDTSWIKDLEGTICGDVCAGVKLDHSLLEHLDILFVADSELHNVVIPSLIPDTLTVVTHSPLKSWDNRNNSYTLDESKYLTGINVLGAGDIFAAAYINAILSKQDLDPLSIAHTTTTKLLGEIN